MPQATVTLNVPAEAFPRQILSGLEVSRSDHTQDSLVEFPQPMTGWRVHDSGALLPTAASADDLGIDDGTFGTVPMVLLSSDGKATTITQYARCEIVIPYEYDAGETLQVKINAGMITTISDTTATVDLEIYGNDLDGTVTADLCSTAAQSINSLTAADKTFTVDGSSLNPGDILDVRVTIAITDSATGTAVKGQINSVRLVADCRG